MTTIKYEVPASIETIFTTELNALADDDTKLSAALSNDAASELDLYADFQLYVAAQASARAIGGTVGLYILIEIDGTNYGYGDDALLPGGQAWVGSFALDNATTARYVDLRGIQLPPFNFKVLVHNDTGQAFAATGSTLKMRRYSLESA
jgi:hypothetical protein